MAKKKQDEPQIELSEIDALIYDYAKIYGEGGEVKAALLKNELTDDEIRLFMYEVKSHREALDTESKFDLSAIEDLAKLRIQENRLMRFQKDLLEEAQQYKNSDEPGLVEQSINIRRDALKLVGNLEEITACKTKIVTALSATRDQRLKVSSESKITLPIIIKQLDDQYTRDKHGIYGELLKKAAAKKHAKMVDEGLIIVAAGKAVIGNEQIQEEKETEEISVG